MTRIYIHLRPYLGYINIDRLNKDGKIGQNNLAKKNTKLIITNFKELKYTILTLIGGNANSSLFSHQLALSKKKLFVLKITNLTMNELKEELNVLI